MKIHEYYRDAANINLNGSIAALIPAIMLVAGNLSIVKSKEIMFLTLPFLIYSLITFQFYLYRLRQSISISKNMDVSKNSSYSIDSASNLLVFYMCTPAAHLYLYFPDGHLAAVLKRHKVKWLDRLRLRKMYILYNSEEEPIAYFKVKGKRVLKIEVYNNLMNYLGCFVRESKGFKKDRKELIDEVGNSIGLIRGSKAFMDEVVISSTHHQLGRLRRGWMPVEWSTLFPEPNTPVLSFMVQNPSEKEKLLNMSLLINEYFIER
jgi:hypothetical protein